MNIAFDVHGTLDNDDDRLLRGILEDFLARWDVVEMNGSKSKKALHKVFVISGPPKDQIKRELDALKIDYTNITIISVVDYLKRKGYYMWNTSRGWFSHPKIWWEAKGMICEEYNIRMIFDDKIQYKANMPETTKFILWRGLNAPEYYGKGGKSKKICEGDCSIC